MRHTSEHERVQRERDARALTAVAEALDAPGRDAHRVLRHIDRDGDGYISADELKQAMHLLGTPIADSDAQLCLQVRAVSWLLMTITHCVCGRLGNANPLFASENGH
jgi:hypothetical protein